MYRFLICFMMVGSLFSQAIHTVPENQTQEEKAELQKQVTDAKITADRWVEGVDQGRFGEAWDQGAVMMQRTMNKQEFERFLEGTRKPLGKVVSRTLSDMRVGYNPAGMPEGVYMVVIYKTIFSGNANGAELVTLYLAQDGKWHVLTYNAK